MDDEVRFGEDMLIRILVNLPVKSLVRFRCISKYWCDLIKSPTFIARHFNRDCKDQILLVKRSLPPQKSQEICSDGDNDLLSHRDPYAGEDVVLSFHDLNFPDLLVSPNLHIPCLKDISYMLQHEYVYLFGPCNGIVCVTLHDTIFLCNPALREFEQLAPSPFTCPEGYETIYIGAGFGFDPKTESYKFIQMRNVTYEEYYIPEETYMRIDLYNSSTNSWKIIDAVVPTVYHDHGSDLLFDGKFHWISNEYIETWPPMRVILSFDISTELFHKLEYPNWFEDNRFPSLVVFEECLAFVRNGRWMDELHLMEIWVMKEYGFKESWTKELVLGPYLFTTPLLCCNNEWLLVETKDNQLASCSIHENQTKRYQFHGQGNTFRALIFTESLISSYQVLHGKTLCKEG